MQLIATFVSVLALVANAAAALLRGTVVETTPLFPAPESALWEEVEASFEMWKKTFDVRFRNDVEEMYRMTVFADNHLKIWEHNNKPDATFKMGHSQFSVLTEEEFGKLFFGLAPLNTSTWWETLVDDLKMDAIPAAVDWVQAGAVTGVKDQGQCGSCWSFSTTGALEGAYFLKTGKLVSFSEQQLVDCDNVDSGCNGGLMDNAFQYVQVHGLTSEAAYPYQAVQGTCKPFTPVLKAGGVQGFVDVPSGDENTLAAAVAQQPVSVAIQATQ